MSEFFGASPSQISKASGHVVDTAQYVEGLRVSVETTANGLLTTGWLGPAAAKFRTAMTTWDNSMRAVRTDLEGIADKMGVNSVVYSAADQDVQAGVGRVESLLNVDVK
ncbi:WXG100 family type VII secretion target [Nonomuraea sp. K274]|uniref:ESAT-6-like protein n=1 Tax=Nonomuraea cypriaca TaxID=1187855 RepID=A0A931A7J2_9ACTN|nr:WXG100 family type VII secretion target [Nonomuraea cypriaca]MBF8185448.1 WXG100 family type VII secretion target [Nonomuraea cypriaca]